jgi:hypothetical protein
MTMKTTENKPFGEIYRKMLTVSINEINQTNQINEID